MWRRIFGHKWFRQWLVTWRHQVITLTIVVISSTRSSGIHSSVMFTWIHKIHDDVIKWKHFPRYWQFVRGIHRSPVNSPHKGQWRGALKFSLICARINAWVNNREAGDLRRNHAHYDVTVMINLQIVFEIYIFVIIGLHAPVASFIKEVNPQLAKRPLKTNGRLINRALTSLSKEATVEYTKWYYTGLRYTKYRLYCNTKIHSVMTYIKVHSC